MANVNDIYKVRFVSYWATGQQAGVNVRHYLCTAKAGTGATEAQIAAGLDVSAAPLYKALLSASVQYRGVGIQKIWPLPILVETFTVVNAGAGTVAGDMLPPQSSGLITLLTNQAGRHFRGRLYVAFPGEADQADGSFIAGYTTRLGSLATMLVTPYTAGIGGNTNVFQPVVYNRVAHTTTNLITTTIHSNVATQRRRGTFGRTNTSPF